MQRAPKSPKFPSITENLQQYLNDGATEASCSLLIDKLKGDALSEGSWMGLLKPMGQRRLAAQSSKPPFSDIETHP